MSTDKDIVDAFMYSHVCGNNVTPQTTITTTVTGDRTVFFDVANGGRPIGYYPVERYEASLRVRGTEFVLAYCDIKPAWYSKLFARLLGLEWYEEMVVDQENFYGGPLLQWFERRRSAE